MSRCDRYDSGITPEFGWRILIDVGTLTMKLQIYLPILLLAASIACGATYQDRLLDGKPFAGFGRSVQTGRYYPVEVVFNGTQAVVQLPSGKKFVLLLLHNNIEDPEEIVATDESGLWWSLFLDDLDQSMRRQTDPGKVGS